MTKIVLSGLQPSGHLNIGNYLGAMKNCVALQKMDAKHCLYGVMDLHALTAQQNPATLAQTTREIAAAYIAAGIDCERSILFVQSAVPAHTRLMWLLATCTQMGKLERMTQFKDKTAGKDAQRVGLGLFAYPVLMAADILLYKTTHVPVGEDQRQHLELTREIASTFNHRFGPLFPLPQAIMTGPAPRVMSLRDAMKKMSKSDTSDMSRINLCDDVNTIIRKIKKAKTDTAPVPAHEAECEGRPEARNLLVIYAGLADEPLPHVMTAFGGGTFAVFKKALADLAVTTLSPITARMKELLNCPDEIDRILEKGNIHARALAAPTLKSVEKAMGIWQG